MSFQALCCIRFIGLIFAISSIAKAWSPQSSKSMLERLRVENKALQQLVIFGLIFIESSLALALLNLMYLQAVLLISLALLMVMLLVLLRLHLNGFKDSCSCYGQWIKLTPLQAMKLDLIYMSMILFALMELEVVQSGPLKAEPITPLIVGIGMMGLGKLRAKF
jgi:hypothetical protein